ncbi:HNH endonuclease signature motif containing protein [Helicobacter pylori]|uniref:HNH endonuclease signature motif containing protein n=1 Tax=Helicobacter pylori TaxID=210 RepID=UPI00287B6F95|nr:HNH endonuclease [Helicobacter pylori]WNE32672.1 HNH endonuclease [Helicobacter pylori]WNE34100.1 HNH endonuclease [Helicobacter pylori]WNE35526.1 HNH endonuclease [Helicobacter pylori]WNE36954.1 HNH endonuclease [Helicobacter pylori]WNE38379.1 HNH endonuclease [Helicobacter pylori]
MAEWKTDTEEVKQIVKACRDFKRSLQEEKCAQFIKNLDSYARGILVERRKIEMQLEKAIGELKKAKSNEDDAKVALRVLQGASILSCIWSPARIATATAVVATEVVLKFMKEDTEKCKRNVGLLERMLEIYSTQAKASVDLVNQAWEGVKKRLHFYTDKHQEFIRRLNYASVAIDNEYNIAPPESLKERDFESPKIAYNPKKSVFDERLKDLREDFSFSLYADLKDKINAFSHRDRTKASKERELENLEDWMGASSYDENPNDELERMANSKEQEFEKNLEDLMPSSLGVFSYDESLNLAKKHCVKNCKKALQDFTEKIKESPNDLNAMNEAFNHLETELEHATENLSQKTAPILERYENYKQQALGYGEFLEKEKEGFIADEQNPYPEEVSFNGLRLAEFESVFSAIVPLEDLDKTVCAHHALKALEAALKNRDLGFDATELEQIAKGFIPKGYLWHFDANVLGKLALVKEELLLSVKHTKGYLLWKQFLQTQN